MGNTKETDCLNVCKIFYVDKEGDIEYFTVESIDETDELHVEECISELPHESALMIFEDMKEGKTMIASFFKSFVVGWTLENRK